MDINGKKLLIVGGAFQHCKVVEAAKRMGVETYVVDYLPYDKAPAKKIADHQYQYNITDYNDIRTLCEEEHIDGVIALCLDACQRPYQHICEMMGFPCFGNIEQFYSLTDKNLFKRCCKQCGVDVIPEYKAEQFENEAAFEDNIEFPVFVKPVDSRGSRGQAVCYTREQVRTAILAARKESSNGEVLIEKYMEGKDDFSVSYVVIDGVPFLTRTGSRFLGKREDGLDRLCIAGISPSKHTSLYMENVENKVLHLIADIGLVNAPFFLQGFVDNDTVRFYDPGLRFPGIEYERMYERAVGVNPIDPLIEFAVTGFVSERYRQAMGTTLLNGKTAIDLLIAIRPGIISTIKGWDEVMAMPEVVSGFAKYEVGDEVGEHHNVNQRFCEIDLLCDTKQDAKKVIEKIYKKLQILDSDGADMKISLLDPGLI